MTVSPVQLKALLRVDDAGRLWWKDRPSNSANADLSAGYLHAESGYVKVMIEGMTYQAHRIVWALTHGVWPSQHIDHINGCRWDNRPTNLRDVSPAENQKNCRLDKRNKSGVCGVRWREDRQAWEASIRVEGFLIHLGRFKDFDEAVTVRKQAEVGLDFHPNHGLVAGKKVEG